MSARRRRLARLAAVCALVGGAWTPALGADDPPSSTPALALPRTIDPPGGEETLAAPQRSARPSPRPAGGEPAWSLHGFAFVGLTRFAAVETFEAIFETARGPVFGGGARIAHRSGVFGQVDVSRFSKDGERVFVHAGEVFRLGIPTRVTMTPVELTGGYRYVPRARPARPGQPRAVGRPRARPAFIPYVGGGIGRLIYKETADFSKAGDDADESFRSYHLVGGVDIPVSRWMAAGIDAGYRWVPDALGENGVSQEFGDTDLGGATIRFRLVVGR